MLYIDDAEEVKKYIKELLKDAYFSKATHNSYAYRIKNDQSLLLEGRCDDGEQGAGDCILRELRRAEAYNILMIVTRYF